MGSSEDKLRQQLRIEKLLGKSDQAKSEELARQAKNNSQWILALVTLLLICAIVAIGEMAWVYIHRILT